MKSSKKFQKRSNTPTQFHMPRRCPIEREIVKAIEVEVARVMLMYIEMGRPERYNVHLSRNTRVDIALAMCKKKKPDQPKPEKKKPDQPKPEKKNTYIMANNMIFQIDILQAVRNHLAMQLIKRIQEKIEEAKKLAALLEEQIATVKKIREEEMKEQIRKEEEMKEQIRKEKKIKEEQIRKEKILKEEQMKKQKETEKRMKEENAKALAETQEMRSTLGLCGFMEHVIHHLMYVKNIYPKEIFTKSTKKNFSFWTCAHPEVKKYIINFLDFANKVLIQEKELQILFVLCRRNQEVLEKFHFELKVKDDIIEDDAKLVCLSDNLISICDDITKTNTFTGFNTYGAGDKEITFELNIVIPPVFEFPIPAPGYSWILYPDNGNDEALTTIITLKEECNNSYEVRAYSAKE